MLFISKIILTSTYIYFTCLFVSNERQNGRTDRARFFWELACLQGRFKDDRIFKNFLAFNKIRFMKVLKIHIFFKIRDFVSFCFTIS